MFRLRLVTFIFLGLFISCTVDEIKRPSSIIDCEMDFSNHPRDSLYQSILDKYVAEGLPGLSVLIRTPQDSLWIGCGGYANIEDGVKMNPCHLHHSASITKTYVAATTLLLVEEGKLDLDDKINQYLPRRISDKLPNGNRITVRQLLNHTSGLLPYNKDLAYNSDVFNDVTAYRSYEEMLSYIWNKPAKFEPGEGFLYSNTNYLLLGMVLDSVTGEHTQAVRDMIFYRLGFENSYYYNNPYPPGIVNSYMDKYGNLKLENVSDYQSFFGTQEVIAADGVISSPLEFALFIESLCKGDVLSESSYAQMIDFSPPNEGYGLGIGTLYNDYGQWLGHDGATIGAGAMMYYNPEKDVTIVTCTNLGMFFDNPMKKVFYYDLWDEILKAVFEELVESSRIDQ